MLKQKTVWEIVTPELHPVVAKMIEAGVAAKCDSYEALAKHIGCPVDGLKPISKSTTPLRGCRQRSAATASAARSIRNNSRRRFSLCRLSP